ncbi:MAG: DUF4279 domain-containing protein [Sphingobacteriales bacterium]
MKKNEIHLGFCISNFNDITHNEITQMLGIQPSHVRIKGEKKNPRNPDSPLIEVNKWTMASGLDVFTDFDSQLDSILNIIESKIDLFKPLCKKYDCEFSCGLFVYRDNGESTPWVHLNSRYNKLIQELDIEFDVDLYVF